MEVNQPTKDVLNLSLNLDFLETSQVNNQFWYNMYVSLVCFNLSRNPESKRQDMDLLKIFPVKGLLTSIYNNEIKCKQNEKVTSKD